MEAQQTIQTLTGEYYLKGVMETASGFKLNEDSIFDFFFSYGALDRTGSGKWQQQGNKVIFNSINNKTKEFSLLNSKIEQSDKVVIKIMDANPSLRSHVYAILVSGDTKTEGMTNSKGEISFPRQEVDHIQLVLEFCPEKTFIFNNSLKLHNYFEFKIEKGIMEVFFDQLTLTLNEEGFEGQHPLLNPGTYRFKKN
jgi:hypothetical protein